MVSKSGLDRDIATWLPRVIARTVPCRPPVVARWRASQPERMFAGAAHSIAFMSSKWERVTAGLPAPTTTASWPASYIALALGMAGLSPYRASSGRAASGLMPMPGRLARYCASVSGGTRDRPSAPPRMKITTSRSREVAVAPKA